jgi:adenylosuccinate synthase
MTRLHPTIDAIFADWFNEPGAHVLVDGQYGSTGKGLIAGVIAEACGERITHVTTNAGPNSGHTAFFKTGDDYEKIVTQQVPVASVFLEKMGHKPLTLLNGGAIVEPEILRREVANWLDINRVFVHPTAALIRPEDQAADQANVATVASTGKGIGPAMINKLRRDPNAVAEREYMPMLPVEMPTDMGWDRFWDWSKDSVFVETAQGFSLGINSGRFYPHTTTRECTVMQAIADARIPAQKVRKVIATFRTFPIRVGNTATGYSGDCYPDQRELSWDDVGQPPELTTVTKRVRRVFTWSRLQFKDCVAANRPDVLFINFLNYIQSALTRGDLMVNMLEDYKEVMGHYPEAILGGYGPLSEDVKALHVA